MSKGNRSISNRDKIAGLVSVLEERKTRLMEEGSSKIKKEPAWEKEYDSLILGDGPKGTYSMDPQVSQVNNNVLVIAGTGGGKTKSVVEANLLHAYHQSMVVLLTKRRLLDQYGPLLKSRGYDVKVLDLVHPAQSDVGYDPMLHLRDDTDIIGLAKALVSASGCTSAKEPYWENSAADLFAAFIKLARLLYWDWARMDRVLKLIRKIDYPPALDEDDCASMSKLRTLNPVDQFVALRKKDPQMFMSWLQYSNNASNTKACIQSMLFSAVNGVLTEGIQQIMAMPKQLEFTPVNPALHPFANLMLGTLFKELFEYAESLPGGRVPIPLTAICDDFATGGQIPNFQQHISIFREKGISVMMLVQSLSQLDSMYGSAASVTIQDNTDNIVYMGGNNLDTAEQMARRINKPMDEVLALPRGQIYLFRSGQKGLQLQRYQIFNDPLYKQKIAPLEAVNTR